MKSRPVLSKFVGAALVLASFAFIALVLETLVWIIWGIL